MDTFLLVLGTIGFLAVCVAAMGMLVVSLPGTWVIVIASAVFAFATSGQAIPWAAVIVFLLLSVGGEVFEAAVTAWGAKKYGGSKWAMLGAIIGGIAGAMLLSGIFPLIGTLVGVFGGAFGGAFLLEYAVNKDFRKARESGKGAFIGRIAAVVAKASLAVGMTIASLVFIIKHIVT